jgi:hypothetical protein
MAAPPAKAKGWRDETGEPLSPPTDSDLSTSVRHLWDTREIDVQATNGNDVVKALLADPAHRSYGGFRGPSIDVGDPPTLTERRHPLRLAW